MFGWDTLESHHKRAKGCMHQKHMGRKRFKFRKMPHDRTFHISRASKSAYWQFLCSSLEKSIDGRWGSEIVQGSVRWVVWRLLTCSTFSKMCRCSWKDDYLSQKRMLVSFQFECLLLNAQFYCGFLCGSLCRQESQLFFLFAKVVFEEKKQKNWRLVHSAHSSLKQTHLQRFSRPPGLQSWSTLSSSTSMHLKKDVFVMEYYSCSPRWHCKKTHGS